MRRDLEIDLLRSFLAVAAHLNFTRAAESVSRTQSAVSLQIKRLEEIVGRPLFDRTRQSVSITPTGEALKVYANRILLANDAALSQIRHPEAEGRIRIGAPDDYATLVLPKILSVIEAEHPRLQIEVVCENTPDLLRMLDSRDLDIAIAVHAPDAVSGQILCYEPLHWVASPGYINDPDDDLSLILWPPKCISREIALESLRQTDRKWRVAYSTRSIGLIESALLSGSAVGVMEASCIPDSLRIVDGQVGLPPLTEVAISLHRSNEEAPNASHVSATIHAVFGESLRSAMRDRLTG
ncbi:LysR substrate-binding domain-containing protein [Denitrobaculum tricleocarpae]|uniref:LysR family transcriptional regulator n=1 Tax=Denitrobaculum tricleocarpae TaxID=2591009 RepID=A0A545SXP2_9PROT|nr:LysR substrate-binding domain-containing protein [Denitrobaculum tricleocarpae]TQV69735.1 LysR family transcriptional regulator [Denitrobaculum tricleocarpae]